MRVIVTGSSSGIGEAIVKKFIDENHEVIGLDVSDKVPIESTSYTHYKCDVSLSSELPDIEGVNILINNAGVQDDSRAIDVNLIGTINCTEKYINPDICAIVNIASSSATSGAEFPRYAASKGGVLTYTKNIAMQIAKYGATCNSISPGGVYTPINKHIIESPELMEQVLNESLLNRWSDCDEIADWVYFVAVINRSMTAQDLLIDNGEQAKFNFIW